MPERYYGIRWTEEVPVKPGDSKTELVQREQYFPTIEERDDFTDTLIESDNFRRFQAWISPGPFGQNEDCTNV